MRRIGFYCLLILMISSGPLRALEPSDEYIQVGCMERAKNLNPYLARSEIELVLQQLVFPPLIADCGRSGRDNNSFVGVLIGDGNFLDQSDSGCVKFGLSKSRLFPELEITSREIVENVERLKQLGSRSNFSFNLLSAKPLDNHKILIHFKTKQQFGKLASATFPVVNFEKLRRSSDLDKWSKNDNIFISQGDIFYLLGYSDYRYESIFQTQNTITLVPLKGKRTQKAKKLSIKTFPDYNQLIGALKANEIQVAMNISPLTPIKDPDIAWADEQFARKSILYLEITDRGRRIGLDRMNMALIRQIRTLFKTRFSEDNLLGSSGVVYCYQGLLNETIENNSAGKPNLLIEREIKLLYTRNTINDRVVRILKKIFEDIRDNQRYTLSAIGVAQTISPENIDKSRFHLIMNSRFINTPEFLNLRFYANHPKAKSFKKEIENLLGKGGETSRLNLLAAQLEQRILDRVPVVFLARYNTRIAYREKNLRRNIDSAKGSPYFFYNLSQWGITHESTEKNH